MKKFFFLCFLAGCIVSLTAFNLDNAIVPRDEILSGGPPKDGIPALLNPNFIKAGEANFLEPDDGIIGVESGGEARAYPIKILNLHEVVNDTINGMPIAVTFWPLTQSGVVYSREIDNSVYSFGVSGRLYKSNVLLYDHQTESLWSQLMKKAIAGSLSGKRLKRFTSRRTTWTRWRKGNPHTLVLSTDTGYERDYSLDPYKGYYRSLGIWFPVGDVRRDLSPKEMVLGVEINGEARAYPMSVLKTKSGILKDETGGMTISLEIAPDGEIAGVKDESGNDIAHIFSYWFAWQAFHPKTTVYKAKE